MNILITGCAGFIGSSLAEKLIKMHNICGIDNFDDYYSISIKENNIRSLNANSNFTFFPYDIRDEDKMQSLFGSNKFDLVIHLAAKAGVRNSFLQESEYMSVNYDGTVKILDMMKKYSVKRIIFASSSSVYGNLKEEKFSEDKENLSQISPYAKTKKMCEEIIKRYSDLYGINAICLRFFTVYGPKQRPDLAISKFANAIIKNEEITIYGDGSSYRDYTNIEDIINGIILAINYTSTPYEIINLGSSNPIKLNELVKMLEKEIGKKAIIKHMPMQKGDVDKTYADITKAKKLLNYIPKVSLQDGLHIFAESLMRE